MNTHVRDKRGGDRYFIDNDFIRTYGRIVGPYGIAVYNVLALHAGIDDQNAWPKYETIAEIAGCSRRQVIRSVQQLEGLNIVKLTARKTKDGRRTSNIITLLHKSEWQPVSSDRQSPPAVTDSHPSSDRQSPEQDPLEQDPSNKTHGAALAATVEQPTNGRHKEPDFLPDAETQMGVLFAGRTNGNTTAHEDAETALQRSGWNIRSKTIKDAAIHFIAATGWEVPRADDVRSDWIKTFKAHVDEFGADRLYEMYSETLRTANYSVGRPGSLTKAMLAIKNSSSDNQRLTKTRPRMEDDIQYQTFVQWEADEAAAKEQSRE